MALASIASLSVADIQKAFSEDGLLYMEDAAIGNRVKELRMKRFPLESAEGLDFCRMNVLEDIRVRRVLEALLPWAGLGIYEVYRFNADQIYAFMTGLNPDFKAVVVQLWSPQSFMTVYGGSRSLPIRGFVASNGLLEIPYAPLKQCNPIDVKMENGGLAIFDARLAFKTLTGFAIYFVFATKEELQGWRKKVLPGDQQLKEKVAQMESPGIGLNYVFKDT